MLYFRTSHVKNDIFLHSVLPTFSSRFAPPAIKKRSLQHDGFLRQFNAVLIEVDRRSLQDGGFLRQCNAVLIEVDKRSLQHGGFLKAMQRGPH
ncbi:hypothetical protein B4135_2707 [Caldibacillus debilis]|uniref:Uncharacterized protein n=1 Tax=Caldibacillus debilis TaxID=301148 RepID=A0A150LT11_9BACI|nr:hypothetical protein B4135_2707 [Caldibacillus debilis]